jgi:hypothetical protein
MLRKRRETHLCNVSNIDCGSVTLLLDAVHQPAHHLDYVLMVLPACHASRLSEAMRGRRLHLSM